jgi:hypothetical protein
MNGAGMVVFETGAVGAVVVTGTVTVIFGTTVGAAVVAALVMVTGIRTFTGLCRVSTLLPPAFTEVSVIV